MSYQLPIGVRKEDREHRGNRGMRQEGSLVWCRGKESTVDENATARCSVIVLLASVESFHTSHDFSS